MWTHWKCGKFGQFFLRSWQRVIPTETAPCSSYSGLRSLAQHLTLLSVAWRRLRWCLGKFSVPMAFSARFLLFDSGAILIWLSQFTIRGYAWIWFMHAKGHLQIVKVCTCQRRHMVHICHTTACTLSDHAADRHSVHTAWFYIFTTVHIKNVKDTEIAILVLDLW